MYQGGGTPTPGGGGGGGDDGRIFHRHQPPHPITPRDSISRSDTPHSDHRPPIWGICGDRSEGCISRIFNIFVCMFVFSLSPFLPQKSLT